MNSYIVILTLFLACFLNAKYIEPSKVVGLENSFEVDGAKLMFPMRVTVMKGNTKIFSDKSPRKWNQDTDGLQYFKFMKNVFIIVSEWDTGDFTHYRLFVLPSGKSELKEFKTMGYNEADFDRGFFVNNNKLYYWEKSFCNDIKKAMAFDERKLDFVAENFKGLKDGICLPEDLSTSLKNNKISPTTLLVN